MTVTLTAPANGAGATNRIKRAPLWGDLEIPVIVGTGEFSSGKTIFGLSICPGPETLVYDLEGSSVTYQSLGFEHVDVAMRLLQKYPNGFTPEERFLWWKQDAVEKGRSGKYRVLVVDPASELEAGLAEHIRKNVGKYNLTMDQMKKGVGIFWGVMKDEWKLTLDVLRTYYDTIYLTVHLRDEFVGNAPSGKREPKGKETLKELASLFLWFEREKGTEVPAASVVKHRLTKFTWNDGEMTPIDVLPPRLPKATPKAIREYIIKPPDYSKLKAGEKPRERVLTKEEELQMQVRIAEANRATAENERSRLEMMQANAAAQATAAAQAAAAIPNSDRSVELAQSAAAKAAANARPPITQHVLDQIVKLLPEVLPDESERTQFLLRVCNEVGAARVSLMNDAQGEGVLSELLAMQSQRKQEALKARGAELLETSPMAREAQLKDPPFDPSPAPQPAATQPPQAATVAAAEQPGPTAAQIEEFQAVAEKAFDPAVFGAQCPALILKHGAPRAGLLTPTQMEALLVELRGMAAAREATVAANTPHKTDGVQLDRLRSLAERTGWAREKQQAWLNDRNLKLFSDATYEQIDDLIEQLLKVELGFSGGVPGNS